MRGTLRNSITAQRGISTSLISYLAAGAVEQKVQTRAGPSQHQLENVSLFYSALKQYYVVFLPQNDSIKIILTIQWLVTEGTAPLLLTQRPRLAWYSTTELWLPAQHPLNMSDKGLIRMWELYWNKKDYEKGCSNGWGLQTNNKPPNHLENIFRSSINSHIQKKL